MKQISDAVFAQVKEALQTALELDPDTDDGDTYYSNALAALDTAQPEPVNAMLVEVLEQAKLWHQGDKWRDDPDNRSIWEDHMTVLNAAIAAAQQAQPEQVNAMLLEALEAAEKLEHAALVALSEATYELKVGNTYTTATDTYKANNELIHRLDKILNLQYRDRKREARLAARQAQPERAPSEDTARIDWLEQYCCDVARRSSTALHISWRNGVSTVIVGPNNHATWRDAIDAAIKQGDQHE